MDEDFYSVFRSGSTRLLAEDALPGGKATTHDVTESLVREWLRNHRGKVCCSECIAKELKQDAGLIRAVVAQLVFAQHVYWAGHCDCGKRGIKHGR